jgi:prepilin-type N-terminal cleavage/methylation domain-containing protein
MKKSGFTLIELLIVIGLLAALAAVLLPSLMGTREDALAGICSYNQAGTLRTLRQYEAITGELPNGMHTGLAKTDGTETMALPPAFKDNLTQYSEGSYLTSLEGFELKALNDIGITQVAYGAGDPKGATSDEKLGYSSVTESSTSLKFISVKDGWLADGNPFSFNGKTMSVLRDEGFAKIITLFVTPTTNWSGSGTGWVKGFGVKMDIPGTCPIPNEEATEFAYYVAYIGLRSGYKVSYSVPEGRSFSGTLPTWSDADADTFSYDGTETYAAVNDSEGTKGTITDGGNVVANVTFTEIPGEAVLIGTSCPECGITNP